MKKKILLVEDEPLIALGEAKMLKKYGFGVVTVHSGEKAVEAVDSDPPISLILMDIDLGTGMDGTEAAQRILEEHDLPIVFLSSHTEPEVVEKTEGISSYGYIVKNSGETVLIASIKMAFRLYKAHMELKRQGEHLRTALVEQEQIEEELIEKSTELDRYFTSSLDMLCIADTQGRFIRLNPEWEKVLGYQIDELQGCSFIDYVHPDDREKTLSAVSRLEAQEEVQSFENRYRCRDGSYRWIEWRSKPIGHIIYAAARDVTVRKTVENDLRNSEEKLQTLMGQSIDMLTLHDMNGNIVDVNHQGVEHTGYSREELLTMSIPDLDPDYYKREDNGHFWDNLEYDQPYRFEARHTRKDGTIIPVEMVLSKVFISGTTYIMTLSRDISERKRSEENLRITLNSIGDAVVATDEQGLVVRMNPVAEKLCGWKREEAYGKTLEEVLFLINANSRERVDNPVARVIHTGETVGLANHTILICKDGSEHQIADSAAPIKNDEGTISGVVLVFRDVTEEYEKDTQLREKEELLEETQRLANIGGWNYELGADRLSWTDEVYRIFGLKPRECEPTFEAFFEAVHPDDRGEVDKVYKESLRQNLEGYEIEHRIVRKDTGEIRRVHEKCNHIKNSEGDIIGSKGMVQDVSEQKRSEEALNRERIFLSTVLDTIGEAIIICNEEGKIIRFNEAARRLHGLPEKPIQSSEWAGYYDLYRMDGSTPLPQEEIPLYRAFRGEQVRNAEIIVSPKNRSPHILSCNGHQLTDKRGKKIGAVIAMHDVTEYKQVENDLRDALTEKNFLMQEINHRIKNNLNMISSLISLKNSEIDSDLSDIKHQIDAIGLIHEKLHQYNEVEWVKVKEYLQELLETVFSWFTFKKVNIDARIEDVNIRTKTAISLGLVVNEIATNAIKYGFTPEKEARFSVDMRTDPEGEHYILTLSNTGNPFPEDVEITTTGSLGLQLITTLVQQLKGTIELKKSPTTVFTLRIPVEQK